MCYCKIENNIIERLNLWSSSTLKNDRKILGTECTTQIKSIIGNYGRELEYEVNASGNSGFESEWLYDVIWSNTNQNGFCGLELVLESEFCRDFGQIKYDFDKLLVTNAKHRIMICMTLADGKGIAEIEDQCRKSVTNYELLEPGSRFLLLIWDDYYSGKFLPSLIIK